MEPGEQILKTDRFIRSLPLEDQKLLVYHCRGLSQEIIRETIGYESPELYWIRLSGVVNGLQKEMGREPEPDIPPELKAVVRQVESIRDGLVKEILEVSDNIDREARKKRNRTKALFSISGGLLLLLAAFWFIWPKWVRPDAAGLFDQYQSSLRIDTATIDTTRYDGNRFYEALDCFLSGELVPARALFMELVAEGTGYGVESRWFAALIDLRQENLESCREQLRLLKESDPVFFEAYGRKLLKKLKN